ncbi:MAG: RloB family protein [Gammaproteobacteria bacterium]|jgi:hypothetical protein
MGSEDLHHKIKEKTLKQLQRKISQRSSYDVVLIVCEGEKTEPYYLREFCDDLKLNNANIKILRAGADPKKIVEMAIKEFNKTNDYDCVYCVFDKDEHPQYDKALKRITSLRENKKNSIPIHAITSVPCFEYWLLLHFEDSTRPYLGTRQSKSAGEQVVRDLKKYIKDYKKGHENIFGKTKSKLKIAIKRAKKNNIQQTKNRTDNPSTRVHELIEYLMNIKNK